MGIEIRDRLFGRIICGREKITPERIERRPIILIDFKEQVFNSPIDGISRSVTTYIATATSERKIRLTEDITYYDDNGRSVESVRVKDEIYEGEEINRAGIKRGSRFFPEIIGWKP
jgi:hypothetical protein